MLRAVLERGIVPDVVIGTSAGALNGAAVAYSPNLTGVAQLDAVWTSLTGAEVFPGSRLSRAWNLVRRETHLFEATGLDALVDRATPARSFADLAVPLRVIATDLDTGEEVVFARGPLKPALLAERGVAGRVPDRRTRRPAAGRRRRRRQRSAVARVRGPCRSRDRLQRVGRRGRPRRALAARRRDDELHAFAQPALRARDAQHPAGCRRRRAPPADRRARAVRLLRRARADRRGAPSGRGGARSDRRGRGAADGDGTRARRRFRRPSTTESVAG